MMLRIVRNSLLLSRRAVAPAASRAMSDEGAIKEEGGKLAKKAAADESQYIRQLEAEQWKALQKHHHDEIKEHEEDIKRHKKRIEEHQQRLAQLKGPTSK